MRVLCIHQEAGSELASLEGPIHEAGHALEVWEAWSDQAAPSPGEHQAIIALGGVVNPDQDGQHPWLERQRAFLRASIGRDVPTLAICLGAQLLAGALGADVRRQGRWELGWYEVERLAGADGDPLLGPFPDRFCAFAWHDYGFALPEGAVPLARSEHCEVQGFRYGERTWALQFHIEADPPEIGRWIESGEHELAEKALDAATLRAQTRRHGAAYVELARGLARRFLTLAGS